MAWNRKARRYVEEWNRSEERGSEPDSAQARPTTLSSVRLTRKERIAGAQIEYPEDVERPRRRGDCENGERPCPWVSCKWHLYLDVKASGSIKLNFPTLEVDELAETCALDVADRGGSSLDSVGDALNLTRERVRQIEVSALGNIQESPILPASSGCSASDR